MTVSSVTAVSIDMLVVYVHYNYLRCFFRLSSTRSQCNAFVLRQTGEALTRGLNNGGRIFFVGYIYSESSLIVLFYKRQLP